MTTYKILRFFRDGRPAEVIRTGLTREEARAHCTDPNTAGPDWFDGWTEENSDGR